MNNWTKTNCVTVTPEDKIVDPGVDASTIKIRPKKALSFPKEVADAFEVENNSDLRTDYFEKDCIRLLPGHPLYDMAKAAAN